MLKIMGPHPMKLLNLVGAVAALAFSFAPAYAQEGPPLETNQSYVEGVQRSTTSGFKLDTKDEMAVFGFVMSKLPERVEVFPTENYYYFGFMHDGIRYAGNIRLDASNRDDGKADFAYFQDTSQWYDDAEVAAPPTYFGYVGYEHSGRLFSPAATVVDIPGATPRSTQLKSSVRRSQPLGTGATASVLPSPLVA